MASRPAARGGDGLMYGLISFAIVSVLALGAFIWQLTANKALADAADSAKKKLQEYGTPPGYYADERTTRQTPAFQVMDTDIQKLAELISGNASHVRPALVEQSAAVLKSASTATAGKVGTGDTLLSAVSKLTTEFSKLKSEFDTSSGQLTDQRAENDTLANGVKATRDEFTAEVENLKKEIERLEAEKTEQLTAKDAQLADQQTANDALTKELNDARTAKLNADQEHEIAFGRLQRLYDDAQRKLAQLKPGGIDITDILAKTDGEVVRAIPGSDLVFITLGKKDNIRPGMGFEVFSPSGDRTVDFRGKARIEVSTVLDNTAECIVTRETPSKPIVEGDKIVNIAYERNRKTRFVVRGDFDMNYDGERDWDGLEKVTALIRDFGGTVVEDLDETVDFVVLGTSPLAPSVTVGRPMSKIVEDLVAERKRRGEDWTQLIERSKTLYVPVLPQAQFLFLIGYGGSSPYSVSQ